MTKRSVINLDLNDNALYDYAFIDHIKGGGQNGAPGLAAWKTGTIWGQQIDASGWPTYVSTDASPRSCTIAGITIPASSDFAGPYIVDGRGTGRITIPLTAATWSFTNISGATAADAQTWNVVDSGSGWSFQLTYSGARQGPFITVSRNDSSATGAYIRNVRFYRAEDATDLAAGKIFRTAWKQVYADFNPSAIRAMNWTGHNDSKNCRFEHRTLPSYVQWTPGYYNWKASPPYGETTGTNQYSLAAVTGTPTSMQHGELATCRIGSGMVRAGSGEVTVTAITKASPGVVTATAHGFNSGDVVVHRMTVGMTQLNYVPCTITVSDANTYSIGIDTSAFTTFTAATVTQYITLTVGSGSDRTAYPVVFSNGSTPASRFGNTYIATGDYKTFYFDKTQAAKANTSGVWTYGVWLFNDVGADKGHAGGTPLEVVTTVVNELTEMMDDPVDLWITIPHRGLLSMDPDYSAGSNFAVNSVDVCLNGANGYAGLNAASKLLIEYSNETWNSFSSGFNQTPYLARRGFLRWGGSTADYYSMVGLRSFVMCQDILVAGFTRSRYKLILSGQGTLGLSVGSMNYYRIYGSTNMLTDVLNPGGATPMSLHDYFAWAAYFTIDPAQGAGAWETNNLATIVTSWVSHAGDLVSQEADCASYVAGFENTGTSGNETVYRYRDVLLPAYASAMSALSKETIMYEGGWDRSVTNGSTDQNNFLKAVKRSRAWANKLKNFHVAFDSTSAARMPADFIILNSRWGHLSPDSYTSSVGGVEWSGVDLAWDLMALRNQSKRQFVMAT
jgi:hypothetical protein